MASRTLIHHELLRNAMSTLGHLGAELRGVDGRFTEERLRLAHGWHQLYVDIKLSHLQHEVARTKVEVSAAEAREARDCALQEAEKRTSTARPQRLVNKSFMFRTQFWSSRLRSGGSRQRGLVSSASSRQISGPSNSSLP
ncbi:hypothetical protein D1007_17505 [Hordeum vulgare]|nr:hypothetical protein D1007_17505 [Hordeum vulgare]